MAGLTPEMVVEVGVMVDAGLKGLDMGETIKIPASRKYGP